MVAVSTTTEAIAELDANSGIGLALIDVLMPAGHPHGCALGRMARLRRPEVRLVFMTGNGEVAEMERDPPGPVLLKPVRIHELIKIVEPELVA